ncbi:response regulator [Pseudobacteriovorax antillogorgiicola]|uniref:Two-component system, chemotaxis family, response regulator CheY n=1 Tax=Pseudobacteriovorax antillogorgiicola TaxID=1513793 RepID=A0A1Y6CV06_9BACT|nr:response regulator [Pseudobacteriovorax antillogorgiicola]TCS44970.1 two-component system chemotaxis response regulator CheY [Pseudobacteriovorax antillogorgiicola]SMF76805.1 two-component system, chemotaxis family, response regulator CheY [Pseudobacteriovorax antillogorgiicola]
MKKILIIDDSLEVRRQLKVILTRDYEIHEAESAEEGMTYLQNHPHPDLVFLDYHMPGLTGLEMLRKLADNKMLRFPVVMLTTEFEVFGSEIKDLNIITWLVKPISNQRVKTLVSQIFLLE